MYLLRKPWSLLPERLVSNAKLLQVCRSPLISSLMELHQVHANSLFCNCEQKMLSKQVKVLIEQTW